MKIGFLGAGKIAAEMARTINGLKGVAEAYAVAAREYDRAKQFADTYGFAKAYGSYEEMLADENVDLVYISTPIAMHYEHVKMSISYGKNVLCEKGFMLNASQAEEVFQLAEEKGILLTEGIWTRYMPSRKMLEGILDSGVIGKATSLCANLGYSLADIERLQEIKLGGGTVLDLGIYTVNFACMVFRDKVEKVAAACTKTERGVDGQDSVTLIFEGSKIASLFSSFLVQTDRRGVIFGDKGFVEVENINNCEKITVYDLERNMIEEYAVPEQITGLEYEVLSCKKALLEGRLECPEMSHSESLRMMQIMDEMRRQMGIIFPVELQQEG